MKTRKPLDATLPAPLLFLELDRNDAFMIGQGVVDAQ